MLVFRGRSCGWHDARVVFDKNDSNGRPFEWPSRGPRGPSRFESRTASSPPPRRDFVRVWWVARPRLQNSPTKTTSPSNARPASGTNGSMELPAPWPTAPSRTVASPRRSSWSSGALSATDRAVFTRPTRRFAGSASRRTRTWRWCAARWRPRTTTRTRSSTRWCWSKCSPTPPRPGTAAASFVATASSSRCGTTCSCRSTSARSRCTPAARAASGGSARRPRVSPWRSRRSAERSRSTACTAA